MKNKYSKKDSICKRFNSFDNTIQNSSINIKFNEYDQISKNKKDMKMLIHTSLPISHIKGIISLCDDNYSGLNNRNDLVNHSLYLLSNTKTGKELFNNINSIIHSNSKKTEKNLLEEYKNIVEDAIGAFHKPLLNNIKTQYGGNKYTCQTGGLRKICINGDDAKEYYRTINSVYKKRSEEISKEIKSIDEQLFKMDKSTKKGGATGTETKDEFVDALPGGTTHNCDYWSGYSNWSEECMNETEDREQCRWTPAKIKGGICRKPTPEQLEAEKARLEKELEYIARGKVPEETIEENSARINEIIKKYEEDKAARLEARKSQGSIGNTLNQFSDMIEDRVK